jgi:hypothetical protein
MKYICIIPHSVDKEEFLKHIDQTKYKNITDVEALKKIDYLEFTYFQLVDKNIKNELYKIQTNISHSFILKHPIQYKSDLHKLVLKKSVNFFSKYFLEQYDLSLDDMSNINKLDPNSLYIIKPTKSFKGDGNKVFKGIKDIHDYLIKNNKNKYHKSRDGKNNKWVIQKYMENPLLLDGKKFHIRWNILLANNNIYMYESAAVFPSAYKYDKNNLDMKIHDTHGESAPVNKHKSFPNDFFDMEYTKSVYKQIYDFFKGMNEMKFFEYTCYEKVNKCFGILGIDFMIDDKYQVKCIEINNQPGYANGFKFTPHLIEGLLDITLYNKSHGKGYINL